MATIQQYEFLGRALALADQFRNRFRHRDPESEHAYSQDVGRETEHELLDTINEDDKPSLRIFFGALMMGVSSDEAINIPLVDCTEIAEMLDRGGDAVLSSTLRPFERDDRLGAQASYKSPWSSALFSANIPGSSDQIIWVVWGSENEGEFSALQAPPHMRRNGFSIVNRALLLSRGKLRVFNPLERSFEFDVTRAALALAAAKNANYVELDAPRAIRRRNATLASVRFSHIEIAMDRPKVRGPRSGSELAEGVAWHHRRGHWKFYSAERPAFGRTGAHGWFWCPYTEVGDRKYGEVIQDYSIIPSAHGTESHGSSRSP